MVTKKQIQDYMLEKSYKPLTLGELIDVFSIDQENQEDFIRLFDEMEAEGEIAQTLDGGYGIPHRIGFVRGTLKGTAKGFGFVVHDPDKDDIFIHPELMNGAIDGDQVLVRLHGRSWDHRSPEGEIVRIIERTRKIVVGTFTQSLKRVAFVIPDDKHISEYVFIPAKQRMDAQDGQKVVVRLSPPNEKGRLEGSVTEILGDKDAVGVDILAIIRKHGLSESFPDEVLKEADQISDEIGEEELKNRRDLRDRVMVTIDGADAKDLDDAVSLEELENGNVRLGVHIADVGYYVKEGSALDREAYTRGTSVYLVDRVIPMLPQRLSNGICSLNPHVDRLSMTCDIEIDGEGQFVSHQIYPSVISINERMTYDDVRAILVDDDEALIKKYAPLVPHFKRMEALARTLNKKRKIRGAIDFNVSEAKILVDENGKPTEIVKRPRTIAEQMIEEFMLSANEVVAEHFHKMKVPFVYRVHDRPDTERLQLFFQFASRLGYPMKGKADTIDPQSLQQLLDKISGTPEETIISTIMLRSMKQAKYETNCTGHFGLAAPFYTHFTSPIRRYPDLLIHRVMREIFEGSGSFSEEREEALRSYLSDAAHQASVQERVAVDAERETHSLKKAEYMVDKVGEKYEGVISGVTSFGFFVELDNTIEGLVHVNQLNDDYYHYEERSYSLIGEHTGNIYRIGDKVLVKVIRVNLDERKIDFQVLKQLTEHKSKRKDKSKSNQKNKKSSKDKPGPKDKPNLKDKRNPKNKPGQGKDAPKKKKSKGRRKKKKPNNPN